MENIAVRLVDLQPMHVVSATGYGQYPETEAWDLILDFTNEQRIDPWDRTHRFFGFNNPDPSPETPEYGYEQWMSVGPDVEPFGEVEIKDFKGGLFAVLRCNGLATISEDWGRLAAWVEASPYEADSNQCLEELLTSPVLPHGEWVFDLYVAITE